MFGHAGSNEEHTMSFLSVFPTKNFLRERSEVCGELDAS